MNNVCVLQSTHLQSNRPGHFGSNGLEEHLSWLKQTWSVCVDGMGVWMGWEAMVRPLCQHTSLDKGRNGGFKKRGALRGYCDCAQTMNPWNPQTLLESD